MRKIVFNHLIITALALSALFTSCNKDNNKDDENEGKGDGTITMTTAKSGEVDITFAGGGTVTIEWKDGSKPETHTMYGAGVNFHVTHNYSNSKTRTIIINGEGITTFECRNDQVTSLNVSNCKNLRALACGTNQLTNLDVSQNTALEHLYCNDNQLKSLDVSKNTRLYFFNCRNNLLDTAALNALFETLSNRGGNIITNVNRGNILIVGNPGASDCDRSIAIDKAWMIDYSTKKY